MNDPHAVSVIDVNDVLHLTGGARLPLQGHDLCELASLCNINIEANLRQHCRLVFRVHN